MGWRADPQAGVQSKDKHHFLVCPVHAAIFKKHGWSKQDLRNYLYKHARIPFGKFMTNKEAASSDGPSGAAVAVGFAEYPAPGAGDAGLL